MNIKEHISMDWSIWFLKIKITPKSQKNEFFSILDNWTLKIRIKAVPENWKANKELISFLSKELGIKKNNIEITSWKTDQLKCIKITY